MYEVTLLCLNGSNCLFGVQGLGYISSSSLKLHGSLNYTSLIIDSHFTLKIAWTVLHHFYNSLHPTSHVSGVLPKFVSLWLAPEVINRRGKNLTFAADIYSLAVFMYELSTRNTPFCVDPANTAQVEGKDDGVNLPAHSRKVNLSKPHLREQSASSNSWLFPPFAIGSPESQSRAF